MVVSLVSVGDTDPRLSNLNTPYSINSWKLTVCYLSIFP